MSTQEAIKEIRELFAEYDIECSDDEARKLIEIGMSAKVVGTIRDAREEGRDEGAFAALSRRAA